MKHFINLEDWSSEEIKQLIQLGLSLKADLKAGRPHHHLEDKNVGMVFDKSSLRTRVSFEVGINQLRGHAIVLGDSAGKLGDREPIPDFARVSSRYVDALVVRTFEESRIEELIRYSNIPVINALTNESHPCQSLADMMTILEAFGELEGRLLTYVGDSNNVARSLLRAATKLGLKMNVASPVGYEFSHEEKERFSSMGFNFFNDPNEAVSGADAIYTDVWTSMGQESEKQQRLKAFEGYMVNHDLMSHAKSDVKLLHCLPAHRGEEISHEAIESEHSIVFDQAENRLHAQKAVLTTLLNNIIIHARS